MFESRQQVPPSRRGAIAILGGAALTARTPLFAFAADFWNRKDPKDWSSEEVAQLTSKSPWAKEVSASSGPPIGGPAGSAASGGRGERKRDASSAGQMYKGVIRWESAQPVMEATKARLGDALANHYVISVTGFPITEIRGPRRSQGGNPNPSMDDRLEHLKGVTSLQPKDQGEVQPGVVQQPPAGRLGTTILFGFSKDLLALTPEDKEVTFVTEFGSINLKVKFNLKDMMYRGELAV